MAELKNFIVAREHQGDRLTDTGSEVHRFSEGDIRVADPSIVGSLVQLGILVEADGEAKLPAGARSDGPTIEEFLEAGYPAENYPPEGYAARSTPEEIAAAIAALAEKKSEGGSPETKVDPPVETKTPPVSPPPPPASTGNRAATKAGKSKAAPAASTKAE
jgi:hypothetical protein